MLGHVPGQVKAVGRARISGARGIWIAGGVVAACAVALVSAAGLPGRDGLREASQGSVPAPADLVIVNGRVFPAGGTGRFVEAVAVRAGTITVAGTASDVERVRGPRTRVIDARGGAVLPGFNDPHIHLFLGALEPGTLDLSEATSLGQVDAAIRLYAAAHPNRQWIVGHGWLYGAFPGHFPTRQQLDAVLPDRPAFIYSYDYHTAWVNSKALALAGITKATRDPPFGKIEKDPATGEPTGVLKDDAEGLVTRLLPKVTLAERLRALADITPKLHRAGITSVQTADSTPDDFVTFDRARAAGTLQLRVYAGVTPRAMFAVNGGVPIRESDIDRLDALRHRYRQDALFKIGVVKLFTDGTVEGYTAKLLAPYANNPTSGDFAYPAPEFERMVTALDRRGWPMMVHAIGDAAVRLALNAYAHAAAVNPDPPRGRRHRVEHIETISTADLPRFGPLGVIASMHPGGWTGASPGEPVISVWAENLGPARAATNGQWSAIHDGGGRVVIGSDWPAADYDTIPRLYAVASPQAGEENHTTQLSMAAAVEAYTSGPAYAAFEDDIKGTLQPGMLADIVVLSHDVFATPLPPPRDVRVVMTILGGRVVYDHATASADERRPRRPLRIRPRAQPDPSASR